MPNLLKKITQRKKVKNEFSTKELAEDQLFISIILSDQELQSALVSKQQKIKEFSSIKTYFDRQDLLTQLDQSLQDLGTQAEEVADCVFIFDESWLKDGDLLDTKKVLVKELSESLSLSALGQMSISEAILQTRVLNDPHDSSLIIYLREKDFDLLLIKHGQLLANLKVGRSAKLSDDLQEGLARISQDLGEQGKYFPNKVFLTSLNLTQKLLHKEQSQLQAFDWTQITGFLQAPEFMVLEEDFLIKALSLAASHMLAKDTNLVADHKNKLTNQIAEHAHDQENLKNQAEIDVKETKLSSFGIDLSDKKIKLDQHKSAMVSDNLQSEELSSVDLHDTSSAGVVVNKNSKSNKKMNNIKRFLKKNRRSLLLGIGSGLLALLVLFLIFTLFLSNVTIKVTPNEQILQKNLEIILDPQIAESDFSQNLLKADLTQKEVSGQDSISTTGISLVGDKAKGEVELLNKTAAEKTFAANTNLTYEDIVFTLDEEITVPAAKEEEGETVLVYGSIKVKVTAKDIGADGNIAKESKLKVADFSNDTYSATAVDSFSGGSSREVRVVSQTDLDNLLNQLRDSLNKLATDEFIQESKDGIYFVPTGNKKIAEFAYDHDEGDEVETLSLSMTLAVEAIKYLSSDLKQLAEAVLLLDLPENYTFVDEEPSLLSDQPQPMADNSNRLVLDAELSAKSKAVIDQESLLNSVLGKSIEEAKSNLQKNTLIKESEIIFQPAFMAKFLQKLPKDSRRLNLIIN